MAGVLKMQDGWSIREVCEYGSSTVSEIAFLKLSDGWTQDQVIRVSELLDEDSGIVTKRAYDDGYQAGKEESHKRADCENDDCACYQAGKHEMSGEYQRGWDDGYAQGFEDFRKSMQGSKPEEGKV